MNLVHLSVLASYLVRLICFVLFALVGSSVPRSAADTLRVPSEYATIQAAVDAASSGDVILVAAGSYEEAVTVNRSGLSLLSEVKGAATIWHSKFAPVVIASADSFTMAGFKIEKPALSAGSRIVQLLGANFLVTECSILRGSPGCLINGAQGGIRRCVISDCNTGLGVLFSSVVLEESEVIRNSSVLGAGILIDSSEATITDCQFIGNVAEVGGGAIAVVGPSQDNPTPSHVLVDHCTFLDNGARVGAAIAAADCELRVRSCTMASNAVLPNSVGGAVLDFEVITTIEPLVLERSIIAFNDGPALACRRLAIPLISCSDIFANEDDRLCGQDGGDNFSLDPLFCGLDRGEVSIGSMSPCTAEHSPGACGLIGALPSGCTSSVSEATWGAIKVRYTSRR